MDRKNRNSVNSSASFLFMSDESFDDLSTKNSYNYTVLAILQAAGKYKLDYETLLEDDNITIMQPVSNIKQEKLEKENSFVSRKSQIASPITENIENNQSKLREVHFEHSL